MRNKKFALIGIACIMCMNVGCKKSENSNVPEQEVATFELDSMPEMSSNSNKDNLSLFSASTTSENQLANGFMEIRSGEQYDFDGDGEKEVIEFTIGTGEDTDEGYSLSINGVKKEGRLTMPTGKVYIGSLNHKSSLQILIEENGYSEDYATVLFSFEDNEIYELGRIDGLVEDIKVLGDGIFQFNQRATTLETWWHPRKFYLANSYYYDADSSDENENYIVMPRLVYMPNELYPVGTQVKLKCNIKLLKSQSLISDDIVMERGEFATIVACDDEEWIYLDNAEGKSGWLQMDTEDGSIIQESQKINPWDIFSGLTMVD